MRRIAAKANEEKTGARALATVCEKSMREFKYELPSSDIKDLVVTPEMIDDPLGESKKLLDNPSQNRSLIAHKLIKEYEDEFKGKHDIGLEFSDEAVELISQKASEEATDVKSVCARVFEDYEHGLKLIKRNTGRSEFTITKEAIEDPSGTLDEWFKKYYTHQSEDV